jgi:hypothetical protein
MDGVEGAPEETQAFGAVGGQKLSLRCCRKMVLRGLSYQLSAYSYQLLKRNLALNLLKNNFLIMPCFLFFLAES